MDFPFGRTVFRDRRPLVADPYSPGKLVPGDWSAASTIELPGSFVAAVSSSAAQDAARSQIVTSKSLYTDPTADVRPGDRIRDGGTKNDLNSGTPYLVPVRPEADVNPFTGWQPVMEIPLTNVEG